MAAEPVIQVDVLLVDLLVELLAQARPVGLPGGFLIIGERAAPEGEAGQAWVVAAVVKHGLKWTPAGASGDFRGRCGVFFRKGLLLVVLWGIIGASHRHQIGRASCRGSGSD